ncbi:MAG: sigma-54-dependent Fis family transcriptional regulator [Glaciecola sp.]
MSSSDKTTELTQIIQQSWQRCEKFGLKQSEAPNLVQLPKNEQDLLDEQYKGLIDTTYSEVLPYYENILSNTQCLIVLADCHGNALNSWGKPRFLSTSHSSVFEKGINWKENHLGTNAIGTVLESGEPVQVQRDEHYFRSNRFMIGSACPIFDANRELVGVLDVSSDAYLPQAHTFGMVKLMAQGIENRLIVSQFGKHNHLIFFNTNADNLDSQWSGLIAFNDDGIIVSANKRAELVLNSSLAMTDVSQIFQMPLNDIKSLPEQVPVSFQALGKFRMHAILKKPNVVSIQTPNFQKKSPVTSKKDFISLEEFSLGDDRINRCIEQAKRVIDKDIPILIHGETGVGKEVFVKALHEYSQRNQQPLIAVNCAAIPSELAESELFGYVKGAFTGASDKGSPGLIRNAHSGTLFLDEIGEMPLKLQGRLLRVLQERKVTPLGSSQSYPVDIKLVSATNRSLRENVANGQFRQDLYYRVSGLNIELPPLRERADRIPLFAKINNMYKESHQNCQLGTKVVELFYNHPWPGNVRQLVSVVQIALAMCDSETVQEWHLPDDFFADLNAEHEKHQADSTRPSTTDDLPKNLDIDPLNETIRIYNETGQNVSKTARLQGISRNTVYKRLKANNII